jgi:membrane-associated HD superfamily phosphohydrolase
MPPRRRNRYEFEHPDEMPLPTGLPLPIVNANVFQPNIIEHIDSQNNRMLEQALKASLEGYGLQEAKEESLVTAGDELFQQVVEQLPYLKPAARQTLHLITGLDDIISHEKNQPSPSNVVELQRIQQTLQKALDTGDPAPAEETDAAFSFITGYDIADIKGAVYPRVEAELARIQIEEAEAEVNEMKQTEDEQIRQALEESLKEDSEQKVKQEAEKTVGGAPPPTTAEGLRAARLGRFSK